MDCGSYSIDIFDDSRVPHQSRRSDGLYIMYAGTVELELTKRRFVDELK